MMRQLSIATGLCALLCLGTVFAQQPEVRSDHPAEYVVKKGDTLWDIAGKFLVQPWYWPAIWQANPQIDNPHLIYPGDRLKLVYVNGRPQLQVQREPERTVTRLSPQIRVEDEAIESIDMDAIAPFLSYPRVLQEEQFEQLAYVTANNEQRIMAGPGDTTYVRGLPADVEPDKQYVIVRLNYVYTDDMDDFSREHSIERYRVPRPNFTQRPELRKPGLLEDIWHQMDRYEGDVLGYEMWEIGRAEVLRGGDPAVVRVIDSRREVRAGDYLMPAETHRYPAEYIPRVMDEVPERARVLSNISQTQVVAHHQIVALNIGEQEGVGPGHVFSVFQPGKRIPDPVAAPRGSWRRALHAPEQINVDFPAEYAGHVMVFRSFEHVSYALVMAGRRGLREGDHLRHPDQQY